MKPNFCQIVKKVYFCFSTCSQLTRQIDRRQSEESQHPGYLLFSLLLNIYCSVFWSYW